MPTEKIQIGPCPTCGALAQAIAGEVIKYRHVETHRLMVNRRGDVHESSPDCRRECSDAGPTLDSDWAWQAALEINRDGDSANTIPIWEIIKKHYLPGGKDALQSVQRAAVLIADARKANGPPDHPPSKLWSALCNIWDHLDTLQQAIAAEEYE